MFPRRAPVLLLAFAFAWPAPGQTPPGQTPLSAQDIMARVAANQDRADAERAHFVYVQHAHVQSRKGRTIMCEETTDTRIAPTPEGQQATLVSLDGFVRSGNRMVHYKALPVSDAKGAGASSQQKQDEQGKDDAASVDLGDKETVLDVDASNTPVAVSDTDIDLVENMRRNLTSQKKSKDGINNGLFPLTSKQQQDMVFELKGRESRNGRDTYHIVFRPRDKNDFSWKGDAWIDADSFEPVVVRTALSRSLPFGVRTLLGTNVPGLGFTVIYAPQANHVWFPASFGTEFTIKVLFLFRRTIVLAVENRSFEQTHVNATVHTEAARPVTPETPDTPGTPR